MLQEQLHKGKIWSGSFDLAGRERRRCQLVAVQQLSVHPQLPRDVSSSSPYSASSRLTLGLRSAETADEQEGRHDGDGTGAHFGRQRNSRR